MASRGVTPLKMVVMPVLEGYLQVMPGSQLGIQGYIAGVQRSKAWLST